MMNDGCFGDDDGRRISLYVDFDIVGRKSRNAHHDRLKATRSEKHLPSTFNSTDHEEEDDDDDEKECDDEYDDGAQLVVVPDLLGRGNADIFDEISKRETMIERNNNNNNRKFKNSKSKSSIKNKNRTNNKNEDNYELLTMIADQHTYTYNEVDGKYDPCYESADNNSGKGRLRLKRSLSRPFRKSKSVCDGMFRFLKLSKVKRKQHNPDTK